MSNPIQWCDETWNTIVGCSPVSSGCEKCYASRMASRFCKKGKPFYGVAEKGYYKENGDYVEAGFKGDVEFKRDRLLKPFSWKKPRRIFVTSMGDLWHQNVTNEQRAAVFGIIAATPQHIYMDLTKRPEERIKFFNWLSNQGVSLDDPSGLPWIGSAISACAIAAERLTGNTDIANRISKQLYDDEFPLENYWAGVSVEDQDTANERIDLLMQTSSIKRFISIEPMLSDIDMTKAMYGENKNGMNCFGFTDGFGYEAFINLVICGAETGPGKRKMNLDWSRSLRDQCKAASVPFWFKKDSDKKETLDGEIHHPEFWK